MLFGGLKFRVAEIFEELIFIYMSPQIHFSPKCLVDSGLFGVFENVDLIILGAEKSCLT